MLRFDETSGAVQHPRMTLVPPDDPLVRRIQRAYPQIYLACHVHHTTSSRAHGLSQRDADVLAHLDEHSPVTAGALARHLGVAASTLSEAIDDLEARGFAERRRSAGRDRRRVELRITKAGVAAMQAGSVLDAARVAALLAEMPPRERGAAVRGIERIAASARVLVTSGQRVSRRGRRPS
jgi:DNA-binding MarR family transcriptional regulator